MTSNSVDSVRRNRFYLWTQRASQPREFDPHDVSEKAEATDVRYQCNVASELDSALKDEGLTFLFTWHLDAFDERLRGAVVILLGEEKRQIPSYAGAAKVIFKTCGTRRTSPESLLHMAPAIAWRVAVREARNTSLASFRRVARGVRKAPLFDLPLGYYGLTEVPWVPFRERTTDVFFAGSVASGGRSASLRPKTAARRHMLAGLTSAQRQLGSLRIACTTSGPFGNRDGMLDPDTYSQQLMNARIALCPRGNIDDTFRLVEAAKSGCVAVTERLPQTWYNQGSPAVQIDRWSSLPKVLPTLLSDSEDLARRSDQMYRWWANRLSERSVARFIVATLSDQGLVRTRAT